MNDAGTLYVLTNPSMPGLVKIGLTTKSVKERMEELTRSSGVPLPFECHFAAEVPSMMNVKERLLHGIFEPDRINKHREFFKVDPERVVMAIQMGPHKVVTPPKPTLEPEEEKALAKAKRDEIKKAAGFTFDSIGIPVGALLRFTRNQSVTATVQPNNEVLYDGKLASLSKAAQRALNVDYAVRGPMFWLYNGETLVELRKRLHG